MGEKIIDFENLTDSREILEAEEPKFIVFFILFTLIMIITALLWMWFSHIDIVVRASGVVRPVQEVSNINNITGGYLEKKNYYNGKRVKKGDLLYKINVSSLESRQNTVANRIDRLEEEIKLLSILKESIIEKENLFGEVKTREGNYYQDRYFSYQNNYEQLELEYLQAKNDYFRLKDLASTTSTEREKLKLKYRNAEINLSKYRNEKITELRREIRNKEDKFENKKNELKEIKERINFSYIKAPIEGVVQKVANFNEGDYISEGIEVLKIVPNIDNGFKMEINIRNEDIAHIEEGQKVRYRFDAFDHQDYGTLEGELKNLSQDAIMLETQGLVYQAKGSINDFKLQSRQGKTGYIRPGNKTEVRIIVRERRILYVLLEKLDFISEIY